MLTIMAALQEQLERLESELRRLTTTLKLWLRVRNRRWIRWLRRRIFDLSRTGILPPPVRGSEGREVEGREEARIGRGRGAPRDRCSRCRWRRWRTASR